QQYQHPVLMANMPIPRLEDEKEREIAAMVDRAAYLRDHALALEDQARALVERTIEEGGR
ncbi:TPA: restriction endonuclease subunit S, partial [Enterobacter cloacae]|nr:restriction endonuclease subunit S [Enterobacter cloacae]